MTPLEINLAITDATGISGAFCFDLNAMHEAEKVLTMDQMRIYQDKLCWWVNHYIYKDQTRSGPAQHFDWVTHATAAQRAEAFLRTIGKWVDTDPATLLAQSTPDQRHEAFEKTISPTE